MISGDNVSHRRSLNAVRLAPPVSSGAHQNTRSTVLLTGTESRFVGRPEDNEEHQRMHGRERGISPAEQREAKGQRGNAVCVPWP